MSMKINLGEFRTEGVGLLSGNPRGQRVRRRLELDEVDQRGEQVTVEVPDDVFAVTSSFFQGLFGPSIKALGEEGFKERYLFTGKRLDDTIDTVVHYVLKKKTPL